MHLPANEIAPLVLGMAAALPSGMRAKLVVSDLVAAARALQERVPTFGIVDLFVELRRQGHPVVTRRYVRQLVHRAIVDRAIERTPTTRRGYAFRLVDQAELERQAKLRASLDTLATKLGGTVQGTCIVLTLEQAIELALRSGTQRL